MTEEHKPDPDERPEPPAPRPVEELGGVMSTGAFAIPMSDLEPDDPPAQAKPPQQPPAQQQPPQQSAPSGPPPTPQSGPPANQPFPTAQPPAPRPVEDLGPIASTGAFAIPMSDLEPDDAPAPKPKPMSGPTPQPQSQPPASPPPTQPQQPPAQRFDPPTQPQPVASQPPQQPFGGNPGPPSYSPPPSQPAQPPQQQWGAPQGGPQGGYGGPQGGPQGGYGAPPSTPQWGGGGPGGPPPGAYGGAPQYGSPPGAYAGAPGMAGQYTLAGWGSRVGAYIIDFLVLLVLNIPGIALRFGLGGGGGAALGLVWSFAVQIGYIAYMMPKTNGQTVGKQVLNIRVVRTDGQQITAGFAIVREFLVKGLLFSGVGIVLCGLGFLLDILWPLWDKENRALHDMVASTRVVDAPSS